MTVLVLESLAGEEDGALDIESKVIVKPPLKARVNLDADKLARLAAVEVHEVVLVLDAIPTGETHD